MEEMTEEEMKEKERKAEIEEWNNRRIRLIQSGEKATYKGLDYNLRDDNTYELIGPAPNEFSLKCFEIPNSLNGKPVTAISKIAFDPSWTKALTSIIIPDSVTNIDMDCLRYIVKSKINLTIDSKNPSYKCVDGALYTKDGKNLLKAGGEKTIFVVPQGVEIISRNAFMGSFNNLKELVIPASVKRIESSIVSFSGNLKTIYYNGTKADWGKITIDAINDDFKKAAVYYYSETPSGNSWNYAADGVTPEITHTSLLNKLFKK